MKHCLLRGLCGRPAAWRAAALALFVALSAGPALAVEAPPCAPPQLVVFDQATADTLIQAVEDDTRYELTFASVAPPLSTLSDDDDLLVPPTVALPSGIQGPILDVTVGATTTTVRILRAERWPNPTGPGLDNLLELVVPDAIERQCADVGVATDTDQDGAVDTGLVLGQCARDNGGEYGFELQLADGVVLNALVSVAPFDISTDMSYDDGVLESASFFTTGRISFSGELSASTFATLDGTRPITIGSFPVLTHEVVVPNLGSVVISVDADVYAGACGSVAAGMRTGVSSTGIANIGLDYDTNVNPLPQLVANVGDSTIDVSPPQLDSDTPVDLTVYGGAKLRTNIRIEGGGVLPLTGADIDLVARGSVRTQVDPARDPWWEISGRPEVYVDISPELLAVDLANYTFEAINPPPTVFFTSDAEFPFPLPDNARAVSTAGGREAGSALRWSRVFIADDGFALNDVAPAFDGGALMVGSGATGLLIRTDYRGERVWQRQVEGSVSVREARQLPDGSFLVAGLRGGDLSIFRMSDSGEQIWARQIETDGGNVQSVRITKAQNGQVTLGGEYLATDDGNEVAPWAASVDANGSVNWFRRYGLPGVDESINATIGLGDGGLLLVGQTDETPPGPTLAGANAYTLRIAADGSVLWSHVWASSTGDKLRAAVQAPDGSFLVGGQTGGTNLDSAPRGLMLRFDEDSASLPTQARWVRAISGSRITADTVFDEIKAMDSARDGFVVAGSSRLGTERTGWLARLVERGSRVDLLWSYFHDALDDDEFTSLTNIGDGLLVAGTSRSFGSGNGDNAMWLLRAPLNGFAGWNDASAAQAMPTALVIDEPPGFPSFADELNITAQAMLTDQEQTVDIAATVTEDGLLFLTPIGIAPQELVREPLLFVDTDGDGIADVLDNCTTIANADQRDSNGDGFGNRCDADLNDDGTTNFVDLGLFRDVFFSNDEDADFSGDGAVNVIDLGVLRQLFFASPGPSGLVP